MSYKNLYLFIIALFVFSCSKDDPNSRNNNNGAVQGVITANINGYAWAAPDGYYMKNATASLTIYGQRDATNTIGLTISPYNGPGNYTFNGITKVVYYENSIEYQSINGQITISSEDDYHIEGTFNCEVISNTGAMSLIFTNGAFNISK